MNELGELLRELRGKKSLRSVAEETGLSHSYISDLEKGKRRGTNTPLHPSPEVLKKLGSAYEYPYDKLLKIAGYVEEVETIDLEKLLKNKTLRWGDEVLDESERKRAIDMLNLLFQNNKDN